MSVSLATTLTPEFCAGTRPADSVFDLPSPARQMQHLNERFLSSTGELGYFTAAYGIIDTATGRGVLCQAGQPSPLIIASDGSVRTLGDGGFVIGLVEEAEFEDQPFELHPGERLVLYSDGISECENADRQPFGEDRLAEMLAADVSLDAIVDALRLWRDGRPYDDDLSMLRVSRAG
jgi:sigma-B regulation protein RsbU (phosphoserine phosphatase)